MKKLIFSFFCLLCLNSLTHAQGTMIGDKITVGHSWTIGNKPTGSKYKFHPTVQLGRNLVYQFNENVGLGFGTFFSSEGATFYNETTKLRNVMTTNYIRVPVFANFIFGDPVNRLRPKLSFGPSVGFLVGGKTYAEDDHQRFVGIKTIKGLDTKIDAGANVSLGWSFRVMDGFWINHDINYYHGLVTNKSTMVGITDFTHRNLGLSMGMLINSDAMKNWKNKMHQGGTRENMHYKHRRPGNYQ